VVADSVVGAGDCFVAFLAMCMSHQMDLLEAIQVAFEAGRIYVQRRYNKPVTPTEMRAHVDPLLGKFATVEELKKGNRDFKLAFTNGAYDLMHMGHLQTLQFAKSKGDKLVVAVNTDASVRRLKGESRPIMGATQRKALLASLQVVDFVLEFDEDTPYNLIQEICCNFALFNKSHKQSATSAASAGAATINRNISS